jgi:hypothetical protein
MVKKTGSKEEVNDMNNKKIRTITKRITMIVLTVIMMFSLAACSGSGSKGSSEFYNYDAPAEAPAPSAPVLAEEYSMDVAMSPEAGMHYDDQGVSAGSGYAGDLGSVQTGRKITFRANLSINTKNFDVDYATINGMIRQYGGYISNEELSEIGRASCRERVSVRV